MKNSRIEYGPACIPGAALLPFLSTVGRAKDTVGTWFKDFKVYTMDPSNPTAEAVVVEEGRIVFVGSNSGAREHWKEGMEVRDGRGTQMLLPGFVDAHGHILGVINGYDDLILSPEGNSRSWGRRIRQEARRIRKTGRGVRGFGFKMEGFGSERPSAQWVDQFASDVPVLLNDSTGHIGLANTKALRMAGITAQTPDPIEKVYYYERDAKGNPTGLIFGVHTWAEMLNDLGFALQEEEVYANAAKVMQLLNREGITTIFDAGIQARRERVGFEALKKLAEDTALPVRIVGSYFITHPNQTIDALENFEALAKQFDSDDLRVDAMKILLDGTFDSRTAKVSEPYTDDPGNWGNTSFTRDELTKFIVAVDRARVNLHIHAIGDGAIHEALDAIEEAQRLNGSRGETRHTICHLNGLAKKDVGRFAELGVIANFSPGWAIYDPEYEKILGDRSGQLYLMNSVHKTGAFVSAGADWPAGGADTLAPIQHIQIGHTRRFPGEIDGPVLGPEGEKVPLDVLLEFYTTGAAHQLGGLDEFGRIATGYAADVVVLRKDLHDVDPNRIYEVPVQLTMKGGRVVYKRDADARIEDWIGYGLLRWELRKRRRARTWSRYRMIAR